jgi:hypothetical protein
MICDEVRRMLGAYVDSELELTRQGGSGKTSGRLPVLPGSDRRNFKLQFTNPDEHSTLQNTW